MEMNIRKVASTVLMAAVAFTASNGCFHSAPNNGTKPAPTAATAANSPQIVFVIQQRDAKRKGASGIYTMDLDGKNTRRVTQLPSTDDFTQALRFSPDRRYITYVSRDAKRNRANEIFIVRTDGSAPIQVTKNAHFETAPVFSPDGSKIVYSFLFAYDSPEEVGLVNTDGTNAIHLTKGLDDANCGDPTFSPDGKRIAFAKNTYNGVYREPGTQPPDSTEVLAPGFNGIATIDTNGGGIKGFKCGELDLCRYMAFSADGSTIIFVGRGEKEYGIYSIKAGGSGLKQLLSDSQIPRERTISELRYSPDSEHILFEVSKLADNHGKGFTRSLYLMGADGKNAAPLFKHVEFFQTNGVFTPDSRKIVFESFDTRDSHGDICTIDVDGSNFKNLTKGKGGGSQPDVR